MERVPAVRASAVRDTLAYLDKFERGARAAVLARVPPASRQVIEETARTGWVPVEHDHFTIDAMIEIFGKDRAIECWTGALTDLIEKPLLKAFVSGMLRVFGSDPHRVIALFPKGWSLAYRDVCTPVLRTNDGGLPVIRFEDVAPEIRLYSNYFHSWHGVCAGFASLAGVVGKVHFTVSPDKKFAEAEFSWS